MYIYIYIYIHEYIHIITYPGSLVDGYLSIGQFGNGYSVIYIYVCMYVFGCIYVSVCIYICMYVYTCIYVHTYIIYLGTVKYGSISNTSKNSRNV
jgi:hypothetical protein